jgi:formamidopyrimidine-DNA glycosylase
LPELPEVERTVLQLRPILEGARFDRVVVRTPMLRTRLPADFAPALEGAVVRGLARRGKYLVARLSTSDALVMHLGMSGSFEVHAAAPPVFAKHDHVVFHLSSGSVVVFNDPRRFGSMRIHHGDADPFVGALGPEPLEREFDARRLAQALRKRRTSLKTALSDQRVVAGLGNIYVSEALHRARLSPRRASRTLVTRSGTPTPAVDRLVRAVRATLADALAARPATADRFRVYDREGRRCARRGCRGTIRRIVQSGRSTFFCPVCQR